MSGHERPQPISRKLLGGDAVIDYWNGTLDTDHDGLPDWWESRYFATSTDAFPWASAANGFSNLQCYWLGLNPTDSDSTFRAQASLQSGTGYPQIRWAAVGGRRYAVEYADSLVVSGASFIPVLTVTETNVAAGVESTATFVDDYTLTGNPQGGDTAGPVADSGAAVSAAVADSGAAVSGVVAADSVAVAHRGDGSGLATRVQAPANAAVAARAGLAACVARGHRGRRRRIGAASRGPDPRGGRDGAGAAPPAARHARDRAIDVFGQLRVWDTEHNNGVLIYLLLSDRDVEIVADRGIAARVPPQQWEAICRAMETEFRAGRFEQGMLAGIAAVGELLAQHFPGRGVDRMPDAPALL